MMAGFWAAAFVVMSSMTALAADSVEVKGSGDYPEKTSVVVGYQDKDLFSNMKNLMPGDTVTSVVTLANRSEREATIYLKAYTEFTTPDGGKTAERDRTETSETGDISTASPDGKTFNNDILNQIDMTLTVGNTVVYKGSADGQEPAQGYKAMSDGDYGISLGKLSGGQAEKLTVELTLPGPTFDNSFASSFDAVDWVFCVEGTTPDNGGGGGSSGGSGGGGGSGRSRTSTIGEGDIPLAVLPKVDILPEEIPLAVLPKLGDTGVIGYVFGILLALLIACGALYLRKRCSRS